MGTTPQSGKQTPHAMSDGLELHSSHILFMVMLLCNSGSSEHFSWGNCHDVQKKHFKTSAPHDTDQLFRVAFSYLAPRQSPWHKPTLETDMSLAVWFFQTIPEKVKLFLGYSAVCFSHTNIYCFFLA